MEKNRTSNSAPSIGGQALIEGILMRGPEKQAIVVRSPEGLVTKVEELTLIKDKYPILGWPIIRGAVNFLDSMVQRRQGADVLRRLLPRGRGRRRALQAGAVAGEARSGARSCSRCWCGVSVLLALGLSMLPVHAAAHLRRRAVPRLGMPAVRNLIEGVVKIAIFLGYLILCSRQKDMRRVFSYHGAEHKTIFCYEAGLPLTVENVRIQPRHHPRCGTSFLFVVIVVSILVSAASCSAM